MKPTSSDRDIAAAAGAVRVASLRREGIGDQENGQAHSAVPEHALTLAVWALPPRPSAVVRARALVRGALSSLGLAADAVDDAVAATSELAGNALRHSHGPYELRLYRLAGDLVIEMVDGSNLLPPMPSKPDSDITALTLADIDAAADPAQLEGGRGLRVVANLTWGRCGARPTTTCTTSTPQAGKAVWFAIEAPDSLIDHTGGQDDISRPQGCGAGDGLLAAPTHRTPGRR